MAQATLSETAVSLNVQSGAPVGPVLQMVDGRPVVSSVNIAEHFRKPHNRVLAVIRSTMKGLPDDFRLSNFRQTMTRRPMPKGNGYRDDPSFDIARDGFTLIVMGFTGKEAMAWKLRYIEAFNAMEAELAGHPAQSPALPSADLSKLTTVDDRRPLKALVDAWVAAAKANGKFLAHTEAFRIARTPVGGRKMKELTLADIPVAMAYVQEQLERELAAASPMAGLPSPEATVAIPAAVSADLEAKVRRVRSLQHELQEAAGEVYAVIRNTLAPSRPFGSPERSLAVVLGYVNEELSYGLERQINAIEYLARAGSCMKNIQAGA